MKELKQFTPERLYRLRKSDVEYISEELNSSDDNQLSIHIAKVFASLLKIIRSVDEVELDHVTGISAQLAMTGVWDRKSINSFVVSVGQDINQDILKAVTDGVSRQVSQKIEAAINRLNEIHTEVEEKSENSASNGNTIKLKALPGREQHDVVVVGGDGRLVSVIGHYVGSIATAVDNIVFDKSKLLEAFRLNPHFTKGAINIVAQGMFLMGLEDVSE